MKRLAVLMPVCFTIMLLAWWALASDYSSYGSWHVYIAVAFLPLVLLWHLSLIVRNKPRMPFVKYALIHVVLFLPIWIWCLTFLSHDSL
jgi:hypothetical protein